MIFDSDSSDFKYTWKETQITHHYEWLHEADSHFKEMWEPGNDTIIPKCNCISISPDHKIYKCWLDASDWFEAKAMQLHENEKAKSKGIPLNKVSEIQEI